MAKRIYYILPTVMWEEIDGDFQLGYYRMSRQTEYWFKEDTYEVNIKIAKTLKQMLDIFKGVPN